MTPMTTFYFTAISSKSQKRRSFGEIQAVNEKKARRKLNSLGLSILTIGLEKPTNWQEYTTLKFFEFEAENKAGKEFRGTIDASDLIECYDQLIGFGLKVKYVCAVTATPAAKEEARKNGVSLILKTKSERTAKAAEVKLRTIKGGLGALVQMAEGTYGKTQKTELAEKQKSTQLESTDNGKTTTNTDTSSKQTAALTDTATKKFESKSVRLRHFFEQFYFHLTEIVIPLAGKTRQDAWQGLKKLLFSHKEKALNSKQWVSLKWRGVLERFWLVAEEIVGTLAFVYFAYFALGSLALRFDWGKLSRLAEITLVDNTTISFLAFSSIFLWFLIWLRERLTSWSAPRTLLLFTCGGIFLFLAGINLP